MCELVTDAFGDVRRFHVYDHDRDEWVMSGADFGGTAAVRHEYEDAEDLTSVRDPSVLVEGRDDLTLVWEDGPDGSVDRAEVDLGTAEVAARALIDALAEDLGVDRERIRIVSMRAPDEVCYFLTGPSVEEVAG